MAPESTRTYRAYGLNVRSEIPLLELHPADGPADVSVRRGRVDRPPRDAEVQEGCWRATAKEVFLYWHAAGAFLIRNGNEIIAEPSPELNPETLRLTLLGPVLGALLHQRGFLVLHASAVVMRQGAVAFLGASRAGKSTTAAMLHAQGYALFADDIIAVDLEGLGYPTVYPGFPRLKLWPDSAIALGHDPETLPPLRPGATKRDRRVGSGFHTAPMPLRCIYVLAWGDAHAVEPLPPHQAFMALSEHCYSGEVLQFAGLQENFHQTSELVRRTPVRLLRRARSLATLHAVVGVVERDLEQDDGTDETAAFL